MRPRYSLRQMLREIAADEARAPKTKRILTHAEIQRRVKQHQARNPKPAP